MTVHVAMPLRTPDGQQFGIGVIDFDLEPEFNRIRADAAEGLRSSLLTAPAIILFIRTEVANLLP